MLRVFVEGGEMYCNLCRAIFEKARFDTNRQKLSFVLVPVDF